MPGGNFNQPSPLTLAVRVRSPISPMRKLRHWESKPLFKFWDHHECNPKHSGDSPRLFIKLVGRAVGVKGIGVGGEGFMNSVWGGEKLLTRIYRSSKVEVSVEFLFYFFKANHGVMESAQDLSSEHCHSATCWVCHLTTSWASVSSSCQLVGSTRCSPRPLPALRIRIWSRSCSANSAN